MIHASSLLLNNMKGKRGENVIDCVTGDAEGGGDNGADTERGKDVLQRSQC